MKNKKTTYIWVLIILEILNIPFVLMALFDKSYTGNPILGYIGVGLNILGLIISLVWLHRLFLLKKDLIKWTNISFGFGILVLLFSSVSIYINSGDVAAAATVNLLIIIVSIVIWVTFIKHIHKSVLNNKIQLN